MCYIKELEDGARNHTCIVTFVRNAHLKPLDAHDLYPWVNLQEPFTKLTTFNFL